MNKQCCSTDMIAVEFPQVYDGMSAWLCVKCGRWENRWLKGTTRHAQTELLMPTILEAHVEKPKP